MADNVTTQSTTPATLPSGTALGARIVTYSGDSVLIAPVGLGVFAGSDDAKTFTDINPATSDNQTTELARLASIISPGLSAAVSVTRTADTNAYTANDVLGSATGSTAALDFNLAAISGSNILITSVAFERDASAIISGETTYNLYLYNVTPPSALGDNAAFDIPSGDRASFLGKINLGAIVDEGSTLYIEANGVNKQIKLSGTHVFGYLVTVGAYAPTSAAVHKVTINAVQL